MLISLARPETRRRALTQLKERFRRTGPESAAEKALAKELREAKVELARLAGDLRSCAGCAKGCPLPAGRWDGGHCCSGNTEDLFCDEEIASLAAAGTRPRHLQPPRGDHAGCAFRGATGCSLAVEHRPTRCVLYLCRDAERELHGRGALSANDAQRDKVSALFEELATARREREFSRSFPVSFG